MPKMNDVTSGEVIDSVWGNDIRDRSLQRVATYTDRDSSYLSPNPGDLVFIEAADIIQVWNGTDWLTLADLTDPAFTGPITATSFTTTNGEGSLNTDGSLSSAGVAINDDFPRILFNSDTAPYQWRVLLNSAGRLEIQESSDGVNFDLVARFSIDEVRTYQPLIAQGPLTTVSDVRHDAGAAFVGYDTNPPNGGDIYWLQARNILISENIPSSSVGLDGDVCLQYQFAGSAQNQPAKPWVKVQGAWRGMS